MKRVKNIIKAVIFDMDGTIIQTEHVWHQVTLDVLAKKGFSQLTNKQQEILKSLSGIGLKRACEIIKSEFKLKEEIDFLFDEKMKMSHIHFAKGVNFIDGFDNFHKKLQENNISTGIATNADIKTLNILSKKMNFEQFFGQNMFCVDHVENKCKPDPTLFLHTAQKLNAKPEECIVFEDSIHGFQAAKAAGMRCIAIKNNININQLHNANHAVSNYHEAESALVELALSGINQKDIKQQQLVK